MTFRQFAIGLTVCFGFAWLAVVVVPFFKLRNPSPVSFQEGVDAQSGIYHPKRMGRVVNGYEVYAENGCYQCHTQVIRPTYAGGDLGRPYWGGVKDDPERGDTRRESNVFDYSGLNYAPIGVTRLGPDLFNVGRRIPARIRAKYAAEGVEVSESQVAGEAEKWLYLHLYNPRLNPELANWSSCPPFGFLFDEREITGARSDEALEIESPEGTEIVPGQKARALVSYLLSLHHDEPVPASMDYSPAEAKGGDQEG